MASEPRLRVTKALKISEFKGGKVDREESWKLAVGSSQSMLDANGKKVILDSSSCGIAHLQISSNSSIVRPMLQSSCLQNIPGNNRF